MLTFKSAMASERVGPADRIARRPLPALAALDSRNALYTMSEEPTTSIALLSCANSSALQQQLSALTIVLLQFSALQCGYFGCRNHSTSDRRSLCDNRQQRIPPTSWSERMLKNC